jgi:serine protease inhibitor
MYKGHFKKMECPEICILKCSLHLHNDFSHHSKVNEEGTEAAAATSIGMASGGWFCLGAINCGTFHCGSDEVKPKFFADHPFAYMLVLNSDKGLTIFNGAYSGLDYEA